MEESNDTIVTDAEGTVSRSDTDNSLVDIDSLAGNDDENSCEDSAAVAFDNEEENGVKILKQKDMNKVLFESIKEKNFEKLSHLVKDEKMDINHVFTEPFISLSHTGWTGLHFVCQKGNAEGVKIMLNLGADPSISNINGDTSLHLASKHGHYQCVDLLLKHDNSVKDDKNLQGLTPLMKAIYRCDTAFKEKDYKKTIDLLLEAGCDVNLSPTSKVSPLHVVAGKWKGAGMISKLLKAGADVNADTGTSSPLMSALCRQKVDTSTVIALIDAGANPNYKNPNNKSVLHIAVAKSEDICVDHLLKAGADPNTEDCDGNTPLWIAVSENNIKITPLLLSNGGNVDFANKQFNLSLLGKATLINSKTMVTILLDHNADVNKATKLGATPLHYAVDNQNITIMKLLLSKNCDLDTYSLFKDLYNPQNALQIALSGGYDSVIKLLFEVGFPVVDHQIAYKRLPRIVKDNDELMEWMYDYIYNPRPLLQVCRVYLRRLYGTSLLDVVDSLKRDHVIPNKLADTVLMKDLLDESRYLFDDDW